MSDDPELPDEQRDEWMNALVEFGVYARDVRDHLDRMCTLIASGDDAFRDMLRLVVDSLWVEWSLS